MNSDPPRKRAARREATQLEKHVGQHGRNGEEVKSLVERPILAALLREPELYQEYADRLRPDLFAGRDHREIYAAIVAVSESEGIPDDILVRDHLQRTNPDLAATVIPMAEEITSTAFLHRWIESAEKAAEERRRKRIADRAQAYLSDGDIEGAVSELKKIEDGSSGDFEARRFDPSRTVEEPTPIFTLDGTTIATEGNLQVLTGGEKAGKSRIFAAMISATLGGDGDNLSFGANNPERKQLVYLDCEQSEKNFYRLINGSLRRAKASETPKWFAAYHCTGEAPKEIFARLRRLLSRSETYAVLVDGFADLVVSPNDEEETFEAVRELHALAIRHQTAIMGVLHQNPGTIKERGHLGSQLRRKAETVITLEREGESLLAYTSLSRGAPIPKSKAIRYGWDNDLMDFATLGSVADERESDKEAEIVSLLVQLADGDVLKSWRHSELIDGLKDLSGKSESTAKRWVQGAVRVHALNHHASTGYYRLGSNVKETIKSAGNADEQGDLEL